MRLPDCSPDPVAPQRLAGRRLESQCRIVRGDAPAERTQLGRGFETDVDEGRLVVVEASQRLDLAPGAVQGQHVLGARSLAQRMLGDQPPCCRHHVTRETAGEKAVVQFLLCDGLELVQSRRLRVCPLLVGELSVSIAAPELETVTERRSSPDRIAAGELGACHLDACLEPRSVEVVHLDPQAVAALLGDDEVAGGNVDVRQGIVGAVPHSSAWSSWRLEADHPRTPCRSAGRAGRSARRARAEQRAVAAAGRHRCRPHHRPWSR